MKINRVTSVNTWDSLLSALSNGYAVIIQKQIDKYYLNKAIRHIRRWKFGR